jgi:hypothetical protein
MKVKRDKSLEPLSIPTSSQEQYDEAEKKRRARLLEALQSRRIYTLRNLVADMGWSEFIRFVVESGVITGVGDHRDNEEDAFIRQEIWRIHRAYFSKKSHPDGKPVFISLRLTPDEARAIAKWHNSSSDKKATYAEIAEFARIVLEQNLEELIRELRPALPAKIRRRRTAG